MNPGLAVTLRPTTPWRIGPDSGVRNRVDSVYHSDTLYSAVTNAMARLGQLDEWLAATARADHSAVCFSSCFPFLDGVRYVAPPRHIWPPTAPSMLASRVRWKSAQFVPVDVVRRVLAGKPLNEHQWTVDGASACLLRAGAAAPFRTSVRWNAAVDRLSGATDRHSVACTEFRSGAGLWTLVSFADESARDRWVDPVKAAFRWLADSGFGGERSRGWGRASAPEFTEGKLPEMILGSQVAVSSPRSARKEDAEPAEKPKAEPLLEATPEPKREVAQAESTPAQPEADQTASATSASSLRELRGETEAPVETAQPEPDPVPYPDAPAPEPEVDGPPADPPIDPTIEPAAEPQPPAETQPELEPEPVPTAPVPAGLTAHWLLSLFVPGPSDTVDWSRGNYALVERGGRIDSPAASGDLKKSLQMIAEGSVVYAGSAPSGSAPDVAPDGFAHPIYRAGFAVSIALNEVTQ